jgi:hypothetical protein
VNVYSNLSGIDFQLQPTTYELFGTVVAGLTSAPISGAVLQLGTAAPFVTTNGTGRFAAPLENGTYLVTIGAPTADNDTNVTLSVSINGADVERNFSLYPPSTEIEGLVVNSQTGLPVPNATVAVTGVTISGVAWSRTYSASALGTLDVPLYQGTYSLNATAGGYLSLRQNLTARSSIQPVVFALVPPSTNASRGAGGSFPTADLDLALVGAAIALGLVLAILLARRSRTGIDARLGPEKFSKVLSGESVSTGMRPAVRLRCPTCQTEFDSPSGPAADRIPVNRGEDLSFAAICPACGTAVEYSAN